MKKQPVFFQAFYLISFFVLFAIGLSLVGYFIYHRQHQRLLQTAKDNLSSIAKLKVEQIENWRQERINDANFIFQSNEIIQEFDEFLKKPAGLKERQMMLSWMMPMFKNRQYISMDILDKHGTQLFGVENESYRINSYEQSIIRNAIQGKQILFIDLHKDDDKKVIMGVIVPFIRIEKRDTTVLGSFLMRIDPHRFLFPLIQSWPIISKTSETLVLRREGDEIIYLNELRHRKGTILAYRRYVHEKKLPAAIAASGYEGVVEGIDYRDEEVVAAVQKIPNSPWYMVAKTDKDEIFAENNYVVSGIIAVLALILLLLASGIRIIWKEQEVKRYLMLLESERDRQALIQHFDYLMRYANDVIFLINEERRIIEANERAEHIYGYNHEELLTLHIDDIQISQLPVGLEDGFQSMQSIAGAVFETNHRKKDGSVFPVEVSGRTITIEGKKYFQAIIRDITDRKESEEELREREKQLTLITNNFPGLVSMVNKDLRYTFASAGYKHVFGLDASEVVGRTMPEVLGSETFKQIERYLKQALTGEQVTFVNPITTPQGDISYGLTTFLPNYDSNKKVIGMYIFGTDITDRILAEDAVYESEDKYRKLIETTDTGFVIIDFQGKVIDANQKYIDLTGHTQLDEIRGHTIIEWTAEHSKEKNIAAVKQCMDDGYIRNLEIEYIHSNGSILPIEINATVVKSESGTNILSLCRDITERKKAEGELLKLKKAIDTSREAIFLTNREGIFTFVNPGFIDLYGYASEDVLGKVTPRILKSGFVKDDLYKEFWRVLLSGQETRGEYVNKRKDGRLIHIEGSANAIYDEKRNIVGFLGIQHDITQRKAAEIALRTAEENFRRSLDDSPLGIRIVTAEGETIYTNKTILNMYGYDTLEELQRTPIHERYTPESYSEFKIRRQQRDQGEFGPSEYEISIKRKDGEIRHIQVFRKEIIWNGVKQFQVIYQDITQRKKLEEPLRQLQKMEGLGTMAGGIAHDFNNILGIILGYVSRIQLVKTDSEKLQNSIEIILKAVDRGTTLVRQILTFARKTETEFSLVDVNDVVKEVTTMIMETFPKTISYSQNLEKGIPQVFADHSQIHQAILNLCVNARDAMHSGGVLTLSTSLQKRTTVQARHQEATADWYICIDVSDTGIGMNDEVLQRIFEPFFTTKEKGKGTGLGLAVVFGVLQTHHGFIDVKSEVKKGTKFRMFLPVPQDQEESDDTPGNTFREIPGGTETILIVEDEEALNEVLKTTLMSKGYSVLTAHDGLAGVNMYKEHQHEISLVLTDLGLPKMTGMEEFKRIRQLNPHARIIVATGYLDPEMRAEFIEEGVQKLIYKPYNPKEIAKIVREVLDEK